MNRAYTVAMPTDLTLSECEQVLKDNHYAHLGCIDGGQPYVFPITYVYKDGFFHGLSLEGHKIDILRKNPNMCIQVQTVQSEYEWESVMCWGTFEEVTDEKEIQEIKLLIADVHGKEVLQDGEPPYSPSVKTWEESDKRVAYKMKPTRMTGKGQKHQQ